MLRLPLDQKESKRMGKMLAVRGSMLLQALVRSVATAGELSVVFLDGKQSHAVRKIPPPGDCRVQGGKVRQQICCSFILSTILKQVIVDAQVPAAAAVVCRAALAAVSQWPLLYARVDLVTHDDQWRVSELEILDPELFLHLEQLAASFADAIWRRVTG